MRSIVILGPRSLQNSILRTYISDSGAIPCQLANTLQESHVNPPGKTLFLIDFSESARHLASLEPISHSAVLALINLENMDQDLGHVIHRFDLRGIFLKDTEPEQFIRGINAIRAGECWLPRKLTSEVFNLLKIDSRKPTEEEEEDVAQKLLTGKEILILRAIVDGLTNHDIAARICLSPHTIKTHIYHIYKKLGVGNRAQAIHWAHQHLQENVGGMR